MNYIEYLKNPYKIWGAFAVRGWFNWMSDESYLKLLYRAILGEKLNIKSPEKFTEKLQWLKLNDRKKEYTEMVDKLEAKRWISRRIGSEYVVPNIGSWNNPNEIDFKTLPKQFVLKCTHDSGGIIVCKDKEKLDIDASMKLLEKCMKKNYYKKGREYPYKNIVPRILAEEYLDLDKDAAEYKFFCFNGQAKILLLCTGIGHSSNRTNDYYDIEFNHLPIKGSYVGFGKAQEIPKEYNEMIKIAEILSKDIPFLRVDLYLIKGKIYVGELTFYTDGGFCRYEPEEWDYKLGEMLEL